MPKQALLLAPIAVALLLLSIRVSTLNAEDQPVRCRLPVSVVSPLPYRNTPLDPAIDFAAQIRAQGLPGVFDPASVEVFDLVSRSVVPHQLSEEFANDDRGRVGWVVHDPGHVHYEIRFVVVPRRGAVLNQVAAPLIGSGDLLRFNAFDSRPLTLFSAAGLADLNGDGQADLFGCWNYARRPGEPWDGVIAYPSIGSVDKFQFGDLARIRYINPAEPDVLRQISHTYMAVDFADFDRDGLPDAVVTRKGTGKAWFLRNSGQRDAGGWPLLEPAGELAVADWEACRIIDLDGDGVVDLVVNGEYIRNGNPAGWPFTAEKPVPLDAGRQPCFLDLDGDGRRDAVCLRGKQEPQPDNVRVAWRRNLGGNPVRFGEEHPLADIAGEIARICGTTPFREGVTFVAACTAGNSSLLLVQHDQYQQLQVFALVEPNAENPRFVHRGNCGSRSAVLSLSDQAWPCVCDWDADGDPDLLIGGGYGAPRIVINEGTVDSPRFAAPQLIESEGHPIRLLRNELLGEPHHWHDMGYSYPVFARWDDDELPDLVLPNETNRIYWYRNIGTPGAPRFGPRQMIGVEGYVDADTGAGTGSASARRRSAERAIQDTYPLEPEQPFFWRTGAALADFNGDRLTDLVTHDGQTRLATLFAQRRNASGRLVLHKMGPLKLRDGRLIDDRLIGRQAHWTESFRAVDWDADGLIDLVYSVAGADARTQEGGSIFLLRNCGTAGNPTFEPPATLRAFGEPIRITSHGPHPWVGDFDGDGEPDLIACVEWSVYPFYRNAALRMKLPPEVTLGPLMVEPR